MNLNNYNVYRPPISPLQKEKPCPSCGYCPTCGHKPSPYYPYYPFYPYGKPYWATPTTIMSTGNT